MLQEKPTKQKKPRVSVLDSVAKLAQALGVEERPNISQTADGEEYVTRADGLRWLLGWQVAVMGVNMLRTVPFKQILVSAATIVANTSSESGIDSLCGDIASEVTLTEMHVYAQAYRRAMRNSQAIRRALEKEGMKLADSDSDGTEGGSEEAGSGSGSGSDGEGEKSQQARGTEEEAAAAADGGRRHSVRQESMRRAKAVGERSLNEQRTSLYQALEAADKKRRSDQRFQAAGLVDSPRGAAQRRRLMSTGQVKQQLEQQGRALLDHSDDAEVARDIAAAEDELRRSDESPSRGLKLILDQNMT
jgi:hypothetical protein